MPCQPRRWFVATNPRIAARSDSVMLWSRSFQSTAVGSAWRRARDVARRQEGLDKQRPTPAEQRGFDFPERDAAAGHQGPCQRGVHVAVPARRAGPVDDHRASAGNDHVERMEVEVHEAVSAATRRGGEPLGGLDVRRRCAHTADRRCKVRGRIRTRGASPDSSRTLLAACLPPPNNFVR